VASLGQLWATGRSDAVGVEGTKGRAARACCTMQAQLGPCTWLLVEPEMEAKAR